MAELRVEGARIEAVGDQLFAREADLPLRKARAGVTQDQLIAAIEDNARDEVVFAGDNGGLYVLSARQLDWPLWHGQPHPGDAVSAGGIDGRVVYVSDEATALVAAAQMGSFFQGAAGLVGVAVGVGSAAWGYHLAVEEGLGPVGMALGVTAGAFLGSGLVAATVFAETELRNLPEATLEKEQQGARVLNRLTTLLEN